MKYLFCTCDRGSGVGSSSDRGTGSCSYFRGGSGSGSDSRSRCRRTWLDDRNNGGRQRVDGLRGKALGMRGEHGLHRMQLCLQVMCPLHLFGTFMPEPVLREGQNTNTGIVEKNIQDMLSKCRVKLETNLVIT